MCIVYIVHYVHDVYKKFSACVLCNVYNVCNVFSVCNAQHVFSVDCKMHTMNVSGFVFGISVVHVSVRFFNGHGTVLGSFVCKSFGDWS